MEECDHIGVDLFRMRRNAQWEVLNVPQFREKLERTIGSFIRREFTRDVQELTEEAVNAITDKLTQNSFPASNDACHALNLALTTAKYKALTLQRSLSRRRRREALHAMNSYAGKPDELILEARQRLNPKQRQYIGWYQEELTCVQMAQEDSGISDETARQRLNRALESFKRAYSEVLEESLARCDTHADSIERSQSEVSRTDPVSDAMAVLNTMRDLGMLCGFDLDQLEEDLHSTDSDRRDDVLFERLVVLELILELAVVDDDFAAVCEKYADANGWPALVRRLWSDSDCPQSRGYQYDSHFDTNPVVHVRALIAQGREWEALYVLASQWAHPQDEDDEPRPWKDALSDRLWLQTSTLLTLKRLQKRQPKCTEISLRLVNHWWSILGLIQPTGNPSIREMTDALQHYGLAQPAVGYLSHPSLALCCCALIAGVFSDNREPAGALSLLKAVAPDERISAALSGESWTNSIQEKVYLDSKFFMFQVWMAALNSCNAPPIARFEFLRNWLGLRLDDFRNPSQLIAALTRHRAHSRWQRACLMMHLASGAWLANQQDNAAVALRALNSSEGLAMNATYTELLTLLRALPHCPPALLILIEAIEVKQTSSSPGELDPSTELVLNQFQADWTPVLS